MELTERQKEKIGLYLQGGLEGEQLTSFLAEVEENDSMAQELKIQQSIQEGIEYQNNLDVRKRLSDIANEHKTTATKRARNSMTLVRIIYAVAVVVLLGLAAVFLMDGKASSAELFAAHFSPSNLTITRSTDQESDIVRLNTLYNTGDYEASMPLFVSILEKEPSAANLRLAYGSALMVQEDFAAARVQFEVILNASDPLYSDHAKWYLALIDLKEERRSSAQERLEELVSDSQSDFNSEAKSLLEELGE